MTDRATVLPLDTAHRAVAPGKGPAVVVRLSLMMFLQYAVWGVWLPILAAYLGAPVAGGGLGFTSGQIGWILGLAGSIGALAAPFIAGQVADRYLYAERALGLLLIVGGILNLLLARTTEFLPFLLLSIVYSVAYMPTLSLTNGIAFQNLRDPEKSFPPVRLWGTIGWIVASTLFTMVHLTATDPVANTARVADALRVSGVISIAYGLYAIVALPRTPPKRDGVHPLAFVRAFALLRNPAFLVTTLIALPVAMIHQVYFIRVAPFYEAAVGVSKSRLGPVIAIGQASEIFFLLILGMFIKRLGYKWVLVLGAAAYATRYGLFALGEPAPLMIAAQLLHGLCYGCFFAGSFLLVEKIAGEDVRHSAQTVFGIIILGLGPILAGFYNEYVLARFELPAGGADYARIWGVQAAVALGAMIVLLVAFPRRFASADTAAAPALKGDSTHS
jgi:nucleoside transporter